MEPLTLEARSTALVLIDLQNSTVARQLAPYPSADVVRNSVRIADALRSKAGSVIFVRVSLTEILRLPVDAPFSRGNTPPPANASELVAEAAVQPTDLVITKRQWGAHSTEPIWSNSCGDVTSAPSFSAALPQTSESNARLGPPSTVATNWCSPKTPCPASVQKRISSQSTPSSRVWDAYAPLRKSSLRCSDGGCSLFLSPSPVI